MFTTEYRIIIFNDISITSDGEDIKKTLKVLLKYETFNERVFRPEIIMKIGNLTDIEFKFSFNECYVRFINSVIHVKSWLSIPQYYFKNNDHIDDLEVAKILFEIGD